MRRVLIRYKVKPEQVQRNEELVRAVYEELDGKQPDGFRYATFRLEDGATFVHVASHERDDGRNALDDIAAFQRFQEGVRDRCEELPVVSRIEEIGSYRLFGDGGRSAG